MFHLIQFHFPRCPMRHTERLMGGVALKYILAKKHIPSKTRVTIEDI